MIQNHYLIEYYLKFIFLHRSLEKELQDSLKYNNIWEIPNSYVSVSSRSSIDIPTKTQTSPKNDADSNKKQIQTPNDNIDVDEDGFRYISYPTDD